MREIDINADLEGIVSKDFKSLHSGGGRSRIPGGQSAANQALSELNISGYAKNR